MLEILTYSRVYKFFTKNNLCNYSLQFGFREQFCTFHALNSLTENLDEVNIGCGIFGDLQKVLILLNIIFC